MQTVIDFDVLQDSYLWAGPLACVLKTAVTGCFAAAVLWRFHSERVRALPSHNQRAMHLGLSIKDALIGTLPRCCKRDTKLEAAAKLVHRVTGQQDSQVLSRYSHTMKALSQLVSLPACINAALPKDDLQSALQPCSCLNMQSNANGMTCSNSVSQCNLPIEVLSFLLKGLGIY